MFTQIITSRRQTNAGQTITGILAVTKNDQSVLQMQAHVFWDTVYMLFIIILWSCTHVSPIHYLAESGEQDPRCSWLPVTPPVIDHGGLSIEQSTGYVYSLDALSHGLHSHRLTLIINRSLFYCLTASLPRAALIARCPVQSTKRIFIGPSC